MIDLNKDISNDHLTQKDIVQLLLHNAQHMLTREELQDVKVELKSDISMLDDKISKVESSLKQDISKLDDKITKVSDKLTNLPWIAFFAVAAIFAKDYIPMIFSI